MKDNVTENYQLLQNTFSLKGPGFPSLEAKFKKDACFPELNIPFKLRECNGQSTLVIWSSDSKEMPG